MENELPRPKVFLEKKLRMLDGMKVFRLLLFIVPSSGIVGDEIMLPLDECLALGYAMGTPHSLRKVSSTARLRCVYKIGAALAVDGKIG